MSVMSQLSQQIQELLNAGVQPEKVASILEVPIDWVFPQQDEDYEYMGTEPDQPW